ncbi:CopG family ribbon-helix-helix protein [Luteimonas sp. A478]
MSDATFTFRVDEGLKAEFAKAAKARDRSGAQLLRDFMREFVRQEENSIEYNAWFRNEVRHGIEEANAGDVVSSQDVEADAAAWRAGLRAAQTGSRGHS